MGALKKKRRANHTCGKGFLSDSLTLPPPLHSSSSLKINNRETPPLAESRSAFESPVAHILDIHVTECCKWKSGQAIVLFYSFSLVARRMSAASGRCNKSQQGPDVHLCTRCSAAVGLKQVFCGNPAIVTVIPLESH